MFLPVGVPCWRCLRENHCREYRNYQRINPKEFPSHLISYYMKKVVSFLLFFMFFGMFAQTPQKSGEKPKETKKANFRVQVFEKKTDEEIKLEEADAEFKKRL